MCETKCEECGTVLEDGDRCLVCVDRLALDTIAGALDRQEWDADTFGIVVDAVRLTGRVVRDSAELAGGCHWCDEGVVSDSGSGPQCNVCGSLSERPTPEHMRTWLRERIARHKADVQMPPAFKGGQGHTAEEIKESGGLWLGIIIVVFMFAAGIGVGWLSFHVR